MLGVRGRIPVPVVGLVAVVVLGAAAGGLTDNVEDHNGLATTDPVGLNWIIAHRHGGLTSAAMIISDLGGTLPMAILAALACLWLAWRRCWAQAALIAAATGGAGALVVIIKSLLGRSRPPLVDHLVVETNQSYPSGHSLGSLVVLGVLTAVLLPQLRARAARITVITLTTSTVVAIGLSRLYLGVHWPTDVLGGWIIGAVWLAACLTTYIHLHPRPTAPDTDPCAAAMS